MSTVVLERPRPRPGTSAARAAPEPTTARIPRPASGIELDVELPPPVSALRRTLKHPRFMQSNRLAATVVAVNVVVLVVGLNGGWWTAADVRVETIALVAQANFALAILVRQQFFLNFLSRTVMKVPPSWPLRLRWAFAKAYHLGGLHVGGAGSGTSWFLALVGSLTYQAAGSGGISTATLAVSYAQVAILVGMVVTAVPPMRTKHHDLFERMHRFGGWTALALFWLSTVLLTNDRRGDTAFGGALLGSPAFWVLTLTTTSSVVPWLLLRRIPVDVQRPSSHVAVLRSGRCTPFSGSVRAISRHPLGQWHTFATIPTPGEKGFRIAVSRAGDWTSEFIDSPPSHVWIRGVPTAGMVNYGVIFRRVVYVVTGSGIGPALAHLLAGKVPIMLVWVTRNPVRTYGQALVDEILAARPDALIWDTDEHGKPDMVTLAYAAYASSGAEAVICISNKKLTWKVVHGMERLGIPALGPIWDS